MKKTILIDGNSLLNRAYFATPLFTTKDGFPTNAVFGFIKLFLKIIADVKPDYAVVAFDLPAPTFRHKMYDGYKATRKKMPDDLAVQMPVLKECLSLMKVKMCEKEGVEADDIIGSLSKKFNSINYIYTGDRDSYQLVDDKTCVCFTKKGVSDILFLCKDNFKETVGLCPAQIIDLKALMGDSSDNIPGVAGVGEKSAMKLLEQYDNVENIYEHLDEITGALHTKLERDADMARLSKKLATIDRDVTIDLELEECALKLPFTNLVRQKFASLEFRILYSDKNLYEEEVASPAQTQETVIVPTVKVTSYKQIRDILSKNREYTVVFDKQKHIFTNDTEYVCSEKFDLLSEGVTGEDIVKILKDIFENPENTVLLYKTKDVMHTLDGLDISFKAKFEDLSLMKYLTDYSGREEDLQFMLDGLSLSTEYLAHSVCVWYERLKAKAVDTPLMKLYETLEKPLCEVLYRMECEGIHIDENYLRILGEEYAKRLEKISANIHRLAGDETFNINSPQQLSKILFEKMGLKGGKKSKNGSYSSSAEILEKLAPDYEIVREVLEYRKIQKLNSTYVEGLKTALKDGKVHTTFMQNITSTGRLSSKNPNLQNIPIRTDEGKEIRKLFLASPDRVLLDADYSQIELRLLAHMSGCPELIQAYQEGKDIHSETAAKVFGVRQDEVTPTMRRAAKAVNFGIIYGESAFGLGQSLNIPASEAAKFIEKYFAAYPAVKTFLDDIVAKARENGYVTTIFGRKREIPELKSANYNVRMFGERAAMNMPLQGSSADIIKIAMIAVDNELRKRGMKSRLILQVHDELLIDATLDEADEASEILKNCMENAASLSVPLTVEVTRGRSWYDAK